LCREASSFWWKCYHLVEMYSGMDPAPDCRALDADTDPDFTKWCWSYRIQIHNIIKCSLSLRRVEIFMDLDSVGDPWNFGVGPDPDLGIHASD
jgi:hypothetical protein